MEALIDVDTILFPLWLPLNILTTIFCLHFK